MGVVDFLCLQNFSALLLTWLSPPGEPVLGPRAEGQPQENIPQDFCVLLNIHLCAVHCLLHTKQNLLYSSYDGLSKWMCSTLSPWILVSVKRQQFLLVQCESHTNLLEKTAILEGTFMFKSQFLLRQKKKFDSMCVKQIFSLFSPIHSF